jgi:hypothetical protein
MKAIDTQAQQKCLNAETKQNGNTGLVCSTNQPSQAAQCGSDKAKHV